MGIRLECSKPCSKLSRYVALGSHVEEEYLVPNKLLLCKLRNKRTNYWYCRVYAGNKKYVYRSLKTEDKAIARDRAYEKWMEVRDQINKTTESEIKLPENITNEIELEPDLENFETEKEENSLEISDTSNNDSDVVYGTGKITDSSHTSFILSNPDSAVKFLLRKELDGRPLKSSQEEIYEGWQKRGLSRGKLRKNFLKIMEWDSVPELEVIEIFNKLKDKVYEIKHSDDK